MDAKHFDELFRSFVSGGARVESRRGVLAGLASGLLAALPLSLGSEDAAAKNKKGKKKKHKTLSPPPSPQSLPPAFNAFGCLDVGQPCQGDDTLCCSGICDGSAPAQGQPDTSVCVAHNSGICSADTNSCEGGAVSCSSANPNCLCLLTTGNAGFCADFTEIIEKSCRFCDTDTDCQAELGPDAACVVLNENCTPVCPATGRTACARPCA
jgi:hypothetical protein